MFKIALDPLKKDFSVYLDSLGLSPKSHKNYRSDLNHFSTWVILKVRAFGSYIDTLSEAVPFLSEELASEYRNFMVENKISLKTINRRLSTLRHLARHLVLSGLISRNFTEGVENVSENRKRPTSSPFLEKFKLHLEAEKVSKNTIKNYVSDVKQFLAWIENYKHA